jgi:chromodomain-containing protein
MAIVDSDHFVVEKIVDHIGNPRNKRSMQFKIRWLGYDESEDLWLPYSECKDLEALSEYSNLNPELHL